MTKRIFLAAVLASFLCLPAMAVDLGSDFPGSGFARGDALNFKFGQINDGKAELNGSSTQDFSASELRAATLRSAAGASDAITLGSGGIVSMPNQSAVAAQPPGNYAGLAYTDTLIATYAVPYRDTQSEMGNATFTADVAGLYLITGTMAFIDLEGTGNVTAVIYAYVNGVNTVRLGAANTTTDVGELYVNFTGVVALAAGEGLTIRHVVITTATDADGYTRYASGYDNIQITKVR